MKGVPPININPKLMPHLSLLLRQFQVEFVRFEEILLSISDLPEFAPFLKNYGGLARRNQTQAQSQWLESLSGVVGGKLVGFFRNLFQGQSFLSSLSSEEISQLLGSFEAAANLAIYNWYGLGNRNFQFRTVVHFCLLEGLGDTLFETSESSYFLSFSEDGLRFGYAESQHIPNCLPVSNACALWEFSTPADFLPHQDSKVFARLRSVQREICFLIDEWEHRNTLLAVEHSLAREDYRAQPHAQTQELFQKTLQKMSVHRDLLAQWCLSAFVEFQGFVTAASLYSKHNSDIVAEIHATDSLLLSGIQKIFLPASVSRHKYHVDVSQKILNWAVVRKQSHPEDLALEMVRVAMSLALGQDESAHFVDVLLNSKSYEWKLDFDPSPGLKTFSWLLNSLDFSVLTMSAICVFSKKINPSSLDNYWMGNLASLAQMPETFMPDAPLKLPSRLKLALETRSLLKDTALDILSKVGASEEQQQCRQFLQDYINHE